VKFVLLKPSLQQTRREEKKKKKSANLPIKSAT
jgi:hypothetical protein